MLLSLGRVTFFGYFNLAWRSGVGAAMLNRSSISKLFDSWSLIIAEALCSVSGLGIGPTNDRLDCMIGRYLREKRFRLLNV